MEQSLVYIVCWNPGMGRGLLLELENFKKKTAWIQSIERRTTQHTHNPCTCPFDWMQVLSRVVRAAHAGLGSCLGDGSWLVDETNRAFFL